MARCKLRKSAGQKCSTARRSDAESAHSRILREHYSRWKHDMVVRPYNASYLVIRPGDRYTAHAWNSSLPPSDQRAHHHVSKRVWLNRRNESVLTRLRAWDDVLEAMLSERLRVQSFGRRSVPGLGNILQGLVSSILLAIASGRIPLLEKWHTAPECFEEPIAGLILERAPPAVQLIVAGKVPERSSIRTSFLPTDDLSATLSIAGHPSRRPHSSIRGRVAGPHESVLCA